MNHTIAIVLAVISVPVATAAFRLWVEPTTFGTSPWLRRGLWMIACGLQAAAISGAVRA